jgi:uncharacterized protein (TIGR03083 family)
MSSRTTSDRVAAGTTRRVGAPMRYRDWMQASEEEYARLLAQLESLSADGWSRRTDCTEWDVRAMVAHLVGAGESNASPREAVRQLRQGKRRLRPGQADVDGINALQVEERAGLSPQELVRALGDVAARAVRGRRRVPAPLRAVPVPFGPPLGVRTVGYLMGRIYTRDLWMHRIDIAQCTGTALELTPEHDGRLVADLVDEWSRAHGRPFDLVLSGPAGGRWSRGPGGERLELDAVEFARILAGRATGSGLLATTVPF